MAVSWVIDTSTMWHLNKISFKGAPLWRYVLTQLKPVMTRQLLEEIQKHRQSMGLRPREVKKLRRNVSNRVKADEYVRSTLRSVTGSSLDGVDNGELSGLILALSQLKSKSSYLRTNSVIFICDDVKARRAEFSKSVVDNVPGLTWWTSADFVIHLAYCVGNQSEPGRTLSVFTQTLEEAINQIWSALQGARGGSTMRESTRQELTRRKQDYLTQLQSAFELGVSKPIVTAA